MYQLRSIWKQIAGERKEILQIHKEYKLDQAEHRCGCCWVVPRHGSCFVISGGHSSFVQCLEKNMHYGDLPGKVGMDDSLLTRMVLGEFDLEEFAHHDLLEMLPTQIIYTKSYPGNHHN